MACSTGQAPPAPRWFDNRPLSVFSVAPLSPISPVSIGAFERPSSRTSNVGQEVTVNQASGVPARVMEEVRREGVAPGSGLGRQEERAQRVQEDEALPLKPGEIGYRASLQAGEVTTTRERPLPTSPEPLQWLVALDLSAKLPPGFGRLLALIFAVILFISTLVAFLIVHKKQSNRSSTIVAPNPPTTTPDGTTTASQDDQLMLGLTSSSFLYLVFIIFLFLETLLLVSQLRQTYIFHRRRHLHRAPAIRPDLESSSSLTALPYTPTGPLRILELLLLLCPTTLLPPTAPTSHAPALELFLEEEAIQRAQRSGAAPRYGSEEMQGSTTLLAGPKMRGRVAERFSWRSVSRNPSLAPSYRTVLRPGRSASVSEDRTSFVRIDSAPSDTASRRDSLPSPFPLPSPRSPVGPSRSSSFCPSLPAIAGAEERGRE